ncbi:hypothetical protein NEMBOFW57_003652 [Staphylotrichum longicolle]|uniref:FAD-binding FR-type domain-containing protein n=1 Tax=Staphylotrichum longicolle TaxID=669026 RepID=A0AAD4I5Z2_9PEZI|nr:hypothetical protein NEMBOFW57_003652 [Staphylotrichum longicolle]
MAAPLFAFLLLPLSCLVHNVVGYKHGIVGYDMGMMGTTSAECYANNTAWLQTMAYCIQQNCNADGYPPEKQAECFSNQAVGGASTPTFHDSLPPTPPTTELASNATWLNETSLVNGEVYHSTHGTLGQFAREEYLHTKYSLILYLVVIGVIVVCGAIAQFAGLLPNLHRQWQASGLLSALRSFIFLPALLGSRRLEPLPGRVGYLPGRALSLFIGVYVVLNIVFSSVSFGNFSPNIWFMSPEFETCEYVGNRTGTLSLVNMSIAILFAGRNNILIALTGWSQTTFMTLHRWTARVATVQAVVHSIAYTVAYFEPGYEGAAAYAAKAAEPFYYWGIIATIALSLAATFAFLPFRIRFYECFLVLHIALVILALAGCWYHLVPHFSFDYGYQVWLYLCFAFWSTDRLARLARVAYYNPLGGSEALIEAIPGCDIMQVTVFPRTTQGFGPGQHSFLYIGGLLQFWQSHPFSVAAWTTGLSPPSPTSTLPSNTGSGSDNDNEKVIPTTTTIHSHPSSPPPPNNTTPPSPTKPSIRFLIRAHAGTTSHVHHRLLASSQKQLPLRVCIEGPYAGHRATLHPLQAADTVLCVAGGIGITHILGVLQQVRQGRQKNPGRGRARGHGGVAAGPKRVVLAWSARERGLIEHVWREFLAGGGGGVEGWFWWTGGGREEEEEEGGGGEKMGENGGGPKGVVEREVKAGRMDIGKVIRECVEAGQQTAVVVCAPGGMADEVTRQVVACVRGGFRVDLVEEAFAW